MNGKLIFANRYTMPLLTVVVIAFGLSGCAKPYDPPILEEWKLNESDSMPGTVESFDGLVDLSQKLPGMRILWVHGMCSHDTKWAKRRGAGSTLSDG